MSKFEEILKTFKKSSDSFGLFLFEETLTPKQKMYQKMTGTFFFCFNLQAFCACFAYHDNLFMMVLSFSILFSTITATVGTYSSYFKYKHLLFRLLNWVRDIQDKKETITDMMKYSDEVSLIIEKTFNKCQFLSKFITYGILVDIIGICILPLVLLIRNESVEYELPFPIYFPFLHPHNLTNFLCNLIVQLGGSIALSGITALSISIFITANEYSMSYLTIIHETIKCFEKQIEKHVEKCSMENFDDWIRAITEMYVTAIE